MLGGQLLLPVNTMEKSLVKQVWFRFLKITLSQGSPQTCGCPGCLWQPLSTGEASNELQLSWRSCWGRFIWKDSPQVFSSRFFGQWPKIIKESNIGFFLIIVFIVVKYSVIPVGNLGTIQISHVLFWNNQLIFHVFIWWFLWDRFDILVIHHKRLGKVLMKCGWKIWGWSFG